MEKQSYIDSIPVEDRPIYETLQHRQKIKILGLNALVQPYFVSFRDENGTPMELLKCSVTDLAIAYHKLGALDDGHDEDIYYPEGQYDIACKIVNAINSGELVILKVEKGERNLTYGEEVELCPAVRTSVARTFFNIGSENYRLLLKAFNLTGAEFWQKAEEAYGYAPRSEGDDTDDLTSYSDEDKEDYMPTWHREDYAAATRLFIQMKTWPTFMKEHEGAIGGYNVRVFATGVEVGCTPVSFEIVEQLYNEMKAFQLLKMQQTAVPSTV